MPNVYLGRRFILLGLQPKAEILENLVQVRNCIVHAAGLLGSYRHGAELRKRLTSMSGVKVSNINFLGDGVEIEQGFLQGILDDVKEWLPNLEKSISEQPPAQMTLNQPIETDLRKRALPACSATHGRR